MTVFSPARPQYEERDTWKNCHCLTQLLLFVKNLTNDKQSSPFSVHTRQTETVCFRLLFSTGNTSDEGMAWLERPGSRRHDSYLSSGTITCASLARLHTDIIWTLFQGKVAHCVVSKLHGCNVWKSAGLWRMHKNGFRTVLCLTGSQCWEYWFHFFFQYTASLASASSQPQRWFVLQISTQTEQWQDSWYFPGGYM